MSSAIPAPAPAPAPTATTASAPAPTGGDERITNPKTANVCLFSATASGVLAVTAHSCFADHLVMVM